MFPCDFAHLFITGKIKRKSILFFIKFGRKPRHHKAQKLTNGGNAVPRPATSSDLALRPPLEVVRSTDAAAVGNADDIGAVATTTPLRAGIVLALDRRLIEGTTIWTVQ